MASSTDKRRGLITLGTLVLAVLIFVFAFTMLGPAEEAETERKTHKDEMLIPFEASDPDLLVEASENVFIGRVNEEVGVEVYGKIDESVRGKPLTEFSVGVREVLKSGGRSPVEDGEEVSVYQAGGELEGVTYIAVGVVDVPEEDAGTGGGERGGERGGEGVGGAYPDAPLGAGKEYLFSTITGRNGKQEITAQPFGDVPLTGADDELRGGLVSKFREAAQTGS